MLYWSSNNVLNGYFKNIDLRKQGRLTRFFFENKKLVNEFSISPENKEEFAK